MMSLPSCGCSGLTYGYFVRQPDANIVPAGNDFGPTPETYKVFDSL